LSKYSIFNSNSKNSKNNLNSTKKNRARTTKQSPLSLHNNKNIFDSNNSNNNTPKLIINLNSKHFETKEKKK
jgi:hypothetical protein